MAKLDTDTPFAQAVAKRDVRRAITIARKDPSVLELKLPSCYDYDYAIHRAVHLKSAPLIEVLLEHGAEVDQENSDGYTALFLAPETCRAFQTTPDDPLPTSSKRS